MFLFSYFRTDIMHYSSVFRGRKCNGNKNEFITQWYCHGQVNNPCSLGKLWNKNLLGLTLSCRARAIPTSTECLFPMYTVWFSSLPLYHLPANTPGIKASFNQLQSFSLSLTYKREKRKKNWTGEYMNVIELSQGPYWGNLIFLVPFFPKVIGGAKVACIPHVLWCHLLSTKIVWTHSQDVFHWGYSRIKISLLSNCTYLE